MNVEEEVHENEEEEEEAEEEHVSFLIGSISFSRKDRENGHYCHDYS